MNLLRRIFVLAALAGLLALAYGQLFPNQEKRIRRVLNRVAAAVSIPAKPAPAGMILALDRLQGCLSREIEVVVDIPVEGRHTFTGREEVMEAAKAAWGNARNMKVEFLDIDLHLDAAREQATAELTARVTQASQRDFFVQEMKLQLRKQEQDWRITRAETVRTLRQ